jgi:hypothetical protein
MSLKGIVGPQSLPLALSFTSSHEVSGFALPHAPYYLSISLKAIRPVDNGLELPKLWAKKPFSLYDYLRYCCSDGKLTNTGYLSCDCSFCSYPKHCFHICLGKSRIRVLVDFDVVRWCRKLVEIYKATSQIKNFLEFKKSNKPSSGLRAWLKW